MGQEEPLLHNRQLFENLNGLESHIEIWDIDPLLPYP